VGICGGVPVTGDGVEILLGDVIISTSVIQIDLGRQYPDKIVRKGEVEDTLGRANPEIQAFGGRLSGYLVRERLLDKTKQYCTEICTRKGFSNSTYPGPGKDLLYPADYRHKHWRKDCMQGPCICHDYDHQDGEVCESALKSSCDELGCDSTLSVKRSRIQRAMDFVGSNAATAEMKEAEKTCHSLWTNGMQ